MPLYNDENPHPEYGTNPNIRNVQGHTDYPKLVFPKGMEHSPENFEQRIIVENEKEELEVAGDPAEYAKLDAEYATKAKAAGKVLMQKIAPQMRMRAAEYLAAQKAGEAPKEPKKQGWS